MQHLSIRSRMDAYGRQIGMKLVDYVGFDSRRDDSLKLHEHSHSGYEFTYVFKGSVVWELGDGTRLRLNGGDMALTQPGVTHKGYLDLIQPAAIFWLSTSLLRAINAATDGFSAQEIRQLDTVLRSAGNGTWFAGDELYRPLALLHSALVDWRSGQTPLALPSVRGLLAHALAASAAITQHADSPRTCGDYVRAVRRFMEEHLAEPLSVTQLADRAGLSTSRLHAIFKQETGLTPNDYLQRMRIDKAHELLARPGARATRVAIDLGFSSSQYFSTCFRKYTGMTPLAFRKRSTAGG